MNIQGNIRFLESFRPGEGKTAGILFLQCFLSGFASAFFFVIASVNFISKVSTTRFPLAYVLSGITGFIMISGYKKKITYSGVMSAYRSSLWAYFISCVGLFAALQYCSSRMYVYVAYLSYVMVMPFSTMFSLSFSTLCLHVFDMGQSKRLLALVNTGDTVAAIGATLFVPFFIKAISHTATPLLLLAAGFTLLSLLPLQQLKKRHPLQFQFVPSAVSAKKVDLLFFTKDKFYLAIAVVSFFSVLAIYLTDYSYLISIRYLAEQTEWKLTTIIATLFSLIKAGELVASLLSKGILSNKGMQFSLLLLPASLAFSVIMGLLSNSIFRGFPFFLIAFLVLCKWSERVIRKGLTAPAMRVLYQVAPPVERIKSQTIIEGPLSQVATVVSGLLLLAASFIYSGAETLPFLKGMAVAGFVAYCCWLLATWRLFKNYKLKIQKNLQSARKQPMSTFADSAAVSIPISAQQIKKKTQNELDWQQIVAYELQYLSEKENSCFSALIAIYNPAVLMTFQDKDKEWVCKNSIRTYLNNNSFFSRLSIIWYMQQMPASYSVPFVKEVYERSDLVLRQQMVLLLHKLAYQPHEDELNYFTGLCYSCAAEVAWMIAALNDVAMLKDVALTTHLQQLINSLKHLLLMLLAITHDAAVIREVEEALMYRNGSSENQLFAIELLDSILQTGLKAYIIPLFEEIPFSVMKNKLQRILPVYSIPAAQRLKELTMKDFKIIDPPTRQIAMEAYFKLTKDEAMLHAFAASKLENMATASALLLADVHPGNMLAKVNAIQKTGLPVASQPLYLSYLMIGGIRLEKRKLRPGEKPEGRYDASKHTAYFFIDDSYWAIDTLGLAILHKLIIGTGNGADSKQPLAQALSD